MGQCLKEYSLCVVILGHKLAGGWGAGDAALPLQLQHSYAWFRAWVVAGLISLPAFPH